MLNFKMNKKNNLDEMQEQKLLHIESNGCWFAFWALMISMIVQMFVSGENMLERMAGEWIVFMCLALYLGGACVKAGIWDRRLKPNAKTNVLVSFTAGGISGLIFAVLNYLEYGFLGAAIGLFVLQFSFVGIICFVALTIMAAITQKRFTEMEEEDTVEE